MPDRKPIVLVGGQRRRMAAGDTVPTGNLGSGVADATTYLRGDQTFNTPAGGGGAEAAANTATRAMMFTI